MADKILILLAHVLEVAFFFGLLGCVFMSHMDVQSASRTLGNSD